MRNFKVVHEIKINTTGLKKDVIIVPVEHWQSKRVKQYIQKHMYLLDWKHLEIF